MSSAAGDARKRPGFMDSFRAALTPPALPPDDGKPLVRPRAVVIASALAMLAGLVFTFLGCLSIFTVEDSLNYQLAEYNRLVAECSQKFGGIGTAVVVPADASADVTNQAEVCKGYLAVSDQMISNFRTTVAVFGALYIAIGVAALVGGWFLRSGSRWGRIVVVIVVLVTVIMSMLFQASNLFTLAASLMLIVAVMLCFIGQGGAYFARIKARRAG